MEDDTYEPYKFSWPDMQLCRRVLYSEQGCFFRAADSFQDKPWGDKAPEIMKLLKEVPLDDISQSNYEAPIENISLN